MSQVRRIVTAGGTLACALGIGYIMQSGEPATQRLSEPTQSQSSKELSNIGQFVDVQEIELTSASVVPNILRSKTPAELESESIAQVAYDAGKPETVTQDTSLEPSCEISVSATPVAAAMVDIALDAPCFSNERLTILHEGLIFTQTTDDAGQMDVTVPALQEQAVFIMAFSNGDGAVVKSQVSSVSFYDRAVVQWKGDSGFQMHAREFGADYDSDGHVWAGAPRNAEFAATGKGGFLTSLGDENAPDPMLAEVYTFPSGMMSGNGEVDLSIEAEVTSSNCAQEIDAQSFEAIKGGDIVSRDITLTVPSCDAIGDFLVLNNLLQDLKVASN